MGDRINELRKANDMTLKELGDKVGVGASTVRKWETGIIETIRSDKFELLASALDTTPAYLMGWEDRPASYKNVEPLPVVKPVPILGQIACGQPILADENLDGHAYVDRRISADFALRCVGDSMINARIFSGDLVFIRAQAEVENGEIAAVLIDDEATLKRVFYYKDRIELRPENPLFPILQYEGAELNDVRIIGKAVAFLSGVR